MKEKFTPVMADRARKQWEAQKHNLPFVVGFVFSTAAGRADVETKGVPSEHLLRNAADVMNDFLKEGKGSAISDAGAKI